MSMTDDEFRSLVAAAADPAQTLGDFLELCASSERIPVATDPPIYIRSCRGAYDTNALLLPAMGRTALNEPVSQVFTPMSMPQWYELSGTEDKPFLRLNRDEFVKALVSAYGLYVKRRNGKAIYATGDHELDADALYKLIIDSISIIRRQGLEAEARDIAMSVLRVLREHYKEAHADDASSDEEEGKTKKPQLTKADIVQMFHDSDISLRLNLVTMQGEVTGTTPEGRNLTIGDLPSYIRDSFGESRKGVTLQWIDEYCYTIQLDNKYNPIIDLLESISWDGTDRREALFNLMGIADDKLSQTFVEKWLLAACCALFNGVDGEPFSIDCVLVLNDGGIDAPGGTGKTSFFSHLAMKTAWFNEGAIINDRDKDTTRRIITTWISELGEIDATFRKSDLAMIKGFVSLPHDKYRLPYGRSDIDAPRHTAMCATCNDTSYLIDPNGNRRFWTVPISKVMTIDELDRFDWLQLWAQIYASVKTMSYLEKQNCFRLTHTERAALDARNAGHMHGVKGQDEVADILDQARREGWKTKQMLVSEFQKQHDTLSKYSVQQIGVALTACGIKGNRTNRERTRELPSRF